MPFRSLFSFPAGSPVSLAVFRIAVFTAFIVESFMPQNDAVWHAGLPPDLRLPPPGLAWLFEGLPIGPAEAAAARAVFTAAAVLAAAGLFTRWAAAVATVSALYLFAILYGFGAVSGHLHHLIWAAALLAFSRCGDALSLDAMLGRSKPSAEAADYRLPLVFATALVGLTYFFSGLWKVLSCGCGWASAENFRHVLVETWKTTGFVPLLPLARWDWACAAGGTFTLVFELLFLPLVFTRLRPFVLAAGLAFHALTKLAVNFFFWSLAALYAAAVDWSRLPLRRSAAAPLPGRPARGRRALIAAGVLLLAVHAVTGAMKVRSWPFAVYPTFDTCGESPLRVTVRAVGRDGAEMAWNERKITDRLHASRWEAVLLRGAGAPAGERARHWRAVAELAAREGAAPGAAALRFEASKGAGVEPLGEAPLPLSGGSSGR